MIGPAQLAQAASEAQELLARTGAAQVLLGLVDGTLVTAEDTPENVAKFRRLDRAGVGLSLGILWTSRLKKTRIVIARQLARRLVGPAFAAAARAETATTAREHAVATQEAIALRDEAFASATAPELRTALEQEFAAVPALALPRDEVAA